MASIAGAVLVFAGPGRNGWREFGPLAGFAAADRGSNDAATKPRSAGKGHGDGAGPIPVTIAKAEKESFPIVVRTFGTVQSPAVAVVQARIASQVSSIPVKDGQMVKAGDLLISLDDRVARAALARDEAMLAKDKPLLVTTKTNLGRASDLFKKGAGTQQARDDALAAQQSAQAAVDADQATIDADQLQLDFTRITAPIDGRLGAVQVAVGDLVGGGSSSASGATPGAGLVTVTQINPIEVIFHLPENDLQVFKAMLDAGNRLPVKALRSGTSGVIAQGVLDFIDSAVDPASGTITMRATFNNDSAALWPGQYVDLDLDQGVIDNATVIPTVAIQPGQDGSFVYVVKPDNTIELRPTKVSRSDGGRSAITSGLAPGESVVTEGQQRLKPGAAVMPAPATTAQVGKTVSG